jgi:hypothetical protein
VRPAGSPSYACPSPPIGGDPNPQGVHMRKLLLALGVAGALAPAASELRIKRAQRPLTDRWQRLPVEPRGSTQLGVSFRPLQAEALGLDPAEALASLLEYPFELIRLSAYWDRIERRPGVFDFGDLDWQVEAAERAGRRIVACLGPVKAFGYPEYFVPEHLLDRPLREGSLVTHPRLLAASTEFLNRVVERYRDREAIAVWQVEHEAVDPLGMEHSWRLAADFVRAEVEAVRAADPSRPILMNAFLPTSLPVRLQQWWRTRDQGDSMVVARDLADIVGIDFYPRNGLVSLGGWTAYLDGSRRPWNRPGRLFDWAETAPGLGRAAGGQGPVAIGRRVMVAEGQAEPWETVTTPPNPADRGMYSCLPEHVIENYNQAVRWDHRSWAYLFWGAEYWLRRQKDGDGRYLDAFRRVLAAS